MTSLDAAAAGPATATATARAAIQRQSRAAVRHHDHRLGHRRHGGRRAASPRSSIWPELNFGIPWLSLRAAAPTAHQCGDLRVRRLRAVRHLVLRRAAHLPRAAVLRRLAAFTFWGWQAVIVLAAITLPLGITSGKEYAELEWPIDILIALVWVAYAVVFFGTIVKRSVSHIYVANWFFGAFIITIALLHIVNSAAMPVIADQVVFRLRRRRRRDGAVVVRAQRGGVLPDRRLPRDDVLLRARSRPAGRSTPIACRSCTSGR